MTLENTKKAQFQIVVLDDNHSTRNLAKAVLEEHLNCRVRICSSTYELLEVAMQSPPDLFLLDVDLGKKNSTESCYSLKEHPDTENVPIVFLSSYKDPVKRVAALKAGGVDYLDKPFYPEELVTRIKTHIEMHRLRLENVARIAEQKALLQVLCHDLVNPVFAAHSLLGLRLESGKLDRATVRTVIDCCQSALDVIKHVRNEHRLVSQNIPVNIECIRIEDAFADSVRTLRQRFKEKNVTLLIEVDPQLSIRMSRIVLVHNIINNLLTNALKFSHPGGNVLLQAYPSEFGGESLCVIEVVDNGIGMPPEVLNHLFDDNANVSRKGTASEEGTGFGMPLVKRYVEKGNGSIDVKSIEASGNVSREAVGTTVKVVFRNQIAGTYNSDNVSRQKAKKRAHAGLN